MSSSTQAFTNVPSGGLAPVDGHALGGASEDRDRRLQHVERRRRERIGHERGVYVDVALGGVTFDRRARCAVTGTGASSLTLPSVKRTPDPSAYTESPLRRISVVLPDGVSYTTLMSALRPSASSACNRVCAGVVVVVVATFGGRRAPARRGRGRDGRRRRRGSRARGMPVRRRGRRRLAPTAAHAGREYGQRAPNRQGECPPTWPRHAVSVTGYLLGRRSWCAVRIAGATSGTPHR